MTKKITIKDEPMNSCYIESPNGEVKAEAFLHNEKYMASRKIKIAELFSVAKSTISESIYHWHIYK